VGLNLARNLPRIAADRHDPLCFAGFAALGLVPELLFAEE
jgi:hypothetical protein